MKFDPTIQIHDRSGVQMKIQSGALATTGSVAVWALDYDPSVRDNRDKRVRFRVATEIQTALDKGETVDLKDDELEIVDAAVGAMFTSIAYGQFVKAVADMRSAPALKVVGGDE